MPDVPLVLDEVAALRAANARLREVARAKDTEIGMLRAQLEACQAQLGELRGGGAACPAAAEPAELLQAAIF